MLCQCRRISRHKCDLACALALDDDRGTEPWAGCIPRPGRAVEPGLLHIGFGPTASTTGRHDNFVTLIDANETRGVTPRYSAASHLKNARDAAVIVNFVFAAARASNPAAPMIGIAATRAAPMKKRRTKKKTVEEVEKLARRHRKEMAFHEAGRAVAAIAHGLTVHFVVLLVDGTAGDVPLDRAILSAAPSAQTAALRVDITVLLAGICAQEKLRPGKYKEVSDDHKLAQAWASWAAFIANVMSIAEFDIDSLIELTKEEQAFADRLLDECQERADQIVAERWSDIEKIAAALLDRNVLNADDIEAIPKPEEAGSP